MGDKQRKNVRCKVRGGISDEAKLNDRPTDTFSGEAGGDLSVPRRKANDTAPGRVACQSLKGETASEKQLRQGKEGIFAYGRKTVVYASR